VSVVSRPATALVAVRGSRRTQQTFCDFELIVVDDASPDDTPQRVAAFADPRVRLVRLAKTADRRASNVGIAWARGSGSLSHDDEWLPNKLERSSRLKQDRDASAAYCRVPRQTSEGLQPLRPRSSFPEGDITDSLLTRDVAMTPSVYVVKRSALLDVGGFDESFMATLDMDLWLRMSQAGYRFVIVPEPLAIYHEDDATARITNNSSPRPSASSRSSAAGARSEGARRCRVLRSLGAEPHGARAAATKAGEEHDALWQTSRRAALRPRHGADAALEPRVRRPGAGRRAAGPAAVPAVEARARHGGAWVV
jgi:hypothetical protein